MSYEDLQKVTDSEEKATRNLMKLVTDYQKDVPTHMLPKEPLYTRLRSIFRSLPWCEILYQRTESYEN